MTDARLRDLERAAQSSGAPDDAKAWRAAQLRAGAVSASQLSLLAYLGDPGALVVLEQPTPPAAPSVEEAVIWLRGLGLWGPTVLYQGVLTWLTAAAVEGPESLRRALAAAFAAPEATDALTLRTAHGEQGGFRLIASRGSWLVIARRKPSPVAALASVIDDLLEDLARGALPPPPPLATLRLALAGAAPDRAVEAGPDLRAAVGLEATPPQRRAWRAEFLRRGPGTYRIEGAELDVEEYVQSCGYETLHCVQGCFAMTRELARVRALRYVGPGTPDGWSVSP